MASEWRELSIGDAAEVVGGGTPSTKEEANFNGDIPWITPKDLAGYPYSYISRGERNISTRGLQNSSARLLPKGSVLLTTRAPVGYVAIAAVPVTTNQGFRSLVPREGFLPQFIYYLLKSKTEYLKNHASGTTFGELSGTTLKGLRFLFPPLLEQRAIAHILGTLDDKIELNRRMNQTLEAMAQALFKSWFVDFEPFRDQGMQNSPLGEIPVGWQRIHLGDFLTLDKGVSYKGEYLSSEGISMINLGCFLGHGKFSSQNIKHYCGEYKSRHMVNSGDIVVANTDITQKREVLGSPAMVPLRKEIENYIFTHHVYALRFPEKMNYLKPFVYLALLQPAFRERAVGFATGTTVLALPRDAILRYQCVIPNDVTIRAFNQQVEPLFTRLNVHDEQSTTLGNIRDTLLPKLLSGEIRVKDAEKFIGRVA